MPAVPGGDVPLPGFGLQLHDHATVGLPDIVATLSWVEHEESYSDGTLFSLRAPRVDVRTANGGRTFVRETLRGQSLRALAATDAAHVWLLLDRRVRRVR